MINNVLLLHWCLTFFPLIATNPFCHLRVPCEQNQQQLYQTRSPHPLHDYKLRRWEQTSLRERIGFLQRLSEADACS